MLKKLSNGFLSKFKVPTHEVNTGKKKDIDSEDIEDMMSPVCKRARKQPGSSYTTTFSAGQKISIPISRRDHYAILDFSHNSRKHKNIEKYKI